MPLPWAKAGWSPHRCSTEPHVSYRINGFETLLIGDELNFQHGLRHVASVHQFKAGSLHASATFA